MFTILGGDGKEYGPVTAGKIHEWIAAGRANLQTKVRREGETEWKTIAGFPELSQFGTMGGSTPPTMTEIPAAPTIPTAATPAAYAVVDQKILARELVANAGRIDVFDCLGRSFKLWTTHFLPIVGVTLLIIFVQFCMQLALSVFPFLGMIAGFFLNGVFYGGLYYYYLGKMREQPRTVGDSFAGFSQAFVPLMLASLLLTALVVVPALPFIFSIFFAAVAAGNTSSSGLMAVLGGGMLLIGVITFLVITYISVCSVFTFTLVIDKGLGPWTALTVSWRAANHQWFRVFFVMFLGGLLAMIGIFGLFIGIFLTFPLSIGALLYAYETLFNPPAKSGNPHFEPSIRS